MPSPRQAHRAATGILSLAMIGIGIALVVSTLARGGGPFAVGVVVGVLFCALGCGRLYLQTRAPHA
jgi:hypothetical protein